MIDIGDKVWIVSRDRRLIQAEYLGLVSPYPFLGGYWGEVKLRNGKITNRLLVGIQRTKKELREMTEIYGFKIKFEEEE